MSRPTRVIVCADCRRKRDHYALERCARCYYRLRYRRQTDAHHAAIAAMRRAG